MTSLEAYATRRVGTRRERLAAAIGLAMALLLLRCPFRLATRSARLARRLGRRPLETEKAERLVAAVRHAARWHPGRAACLETSLGATLAAALLLRRLDWRLGVRLTPPPTIRHAWSALPDGTPVGELESDDWRYHTALRI